MPRSLFYFRTGQPYGPSALVGVDASGQVFDLDVESPLFPWSVNRKADRLARIREWLRCSH